MYVVVVVKCVQPLPIRWAAKSDVPVLLLHLWLNGLTSLSNIHLATIIQDAAHTCSLQSQVILYKIEKDGDLPGRQANTHDVVFGWPSANMAVCHLDIWQRGK